MSIFARPPSPPPRQPSPEPVYTPLPSPHVRARQRTMSSQVSSSSPTTPPGLAPRPQPKLIHVVRSYDHLHERSREPRFRSTRARSTLTISPPSTPRSLPPPSPSRSQFNDSPSYRRTLSQAIPYRSPPPSPTIAAPPPPVPPIPSFVLSPPAQIKSTLPKPNRPLPSPITPIRIQDLEDISPLSEFSHITSKFVPASQPPSPEKTKSVGLTCLKFFSLRNSKRGTTHTSRP